MRMIQRMLMAQVFPFFQFETHKTRSYAAAFFSFVEELGTIGARRSGG
jgi:hypothetical protein